MSFNEKRSYTEYNVTASTSVFAIGFDDYNLASKDRIIVTIDGVEATEAGYTVTRSSPSTLTLNPAVESGVVRLTRETNIDQTFNKFTAGSLFTPKNVNDNFEQILRSQQEVEDRQSKLEGDVLPVVAGLEDALAAAESASQAAEEAANAATDAASSAEFFGSNYGKGIRPLWKDELKPYTQWAEVRLDNGDIMRNIIPNNTNDPNSDMTGWEFSNSPNSIITVNSVAEMLLLRAFDGLTVKTKSYNTPNLALANPYHGGMTYVYNSSRSTENDSGSVINGWVALFPENQVINVDWFGADPTKTIDSTNAVLAAILYACGNLTSNFKAGVTKKAVIEYSAGIYIQGDIPLISCCTYKGQGKFATQILPNLTAQWIFKTIGSYEGSTINVNTRLIYNSIKGMTVGYGYVDSVVMENNYAGGIYREAGSWNSIDDVAICGLGGNGLKLIGDFDGDFNYLTMMLVGYAQSAAALYIDRSTGSADGSNAMSFRRLHIEGCYQHFYIGRNSRHIWFDWAKFEACSVSSVIEDNQGIIFDNLECSVSQTGFPWINVIASSGYSPFVVEFNNPSLIGVGWFINNTTNFKVKITGGSGRRVNKLATGKHLIIDGIYTYDCGAQLMTLGFSTIKNCKFSAQKTTTITDGTADVIILTDSGNKVIDCEFDGQGNSSDGVAFINITASSNSRIIDNDFGAGKQYGIRGSATTNQRDNTYANTAFTGTNVNYTSLVNTNNIGFNSSGGTKSVFSVVNADTTGTIANIIAGASILSVRDANLALIGIVFADSTGRINIVMQNGIQTALLGTGVSGDGKIYLRVSGSSLVVENRTTSQLRLTVLAQSAV